MKQNLLKPKQAAKAYGVTVTELFELIANGDVPSVAVGRFLLVPEAHAHASARSAIHNFRGGR